MRSAFSPKGSIRSSRIVVPEEGGEGEGGTEGLVRRTSSSPPVKRETKIVIASSTPAKRPHNDATQVVLK